MSIFLIAIACNNDNEEKALGNLILHKEKIDLLWVDEGENSAIKIKDKDFISKLIKKTADINVSKLSIQQEKDFFQKFLNDNKLILIDFHEELSGDPAYGRIFISKDGTIVAIDTITDQSSKRTVSYLALNKYPELYEWIKKNLQTENI